MDKIVFLVILIFSGMAHAQIVSIESKILNTSRSVQINLPPEYNAAQSYPVIYVLDGDYLGSYVAGIITNNAYWERAPECIVISILQKDTRWKDCKYNREGNLTGSGEDFMRFLKTELIPFVDQKYSTNEYRALVGHSFTANFVNFSLLDKESLFRGFVAMSPYFSNNTFEKVSEFKAELIPSYFLSIGEDDLSGHIQSVNDHKKAFDENDCIQFEYKKYKNANHTSLVNASLSDGIDHLFKDYGTFESEHYALMKKDSVSAFNYFLKYYERITEVYDIKLEYRMRDAEVVSTNIERSKKWEELNEFGEFCIIHFPEEYFGFYNKANYYKSIKDYENALKYYELGYSKLSEDILNKEDFYADILEVKKKL